MIVGALDGREAGGMWRMLTGQAKDLRIELIDHDTQGERGSAHWRAHYTFSQTGRPVINDVQASFADLSAALGYADQRTFALQEVPVPPAPPMDLTSLIQQALQNRPELVGERLDVNSAKTYATAERDLWFPTISAAGVTGLVPFRQDNLTSRYAAAGFNVNVPIFNGRLFNAEHTEATARAHAQEQFLRDLQNRIAQDVRTSWLNVISAYQRLSLTQQLLDQTTQAFDLAKGRYSLGLSSIIELSQAQLNLTEAQVEQVSAQYDYESQTANLNYQVGRVK